MILDFLRQSLVNRLGGWQNATDCHYNMAVYRAKCKVIDALPEIDLAKAKYKEQVGIGITGIRPSSTNSNAVPAQQVLSLDDIV